MNKQTQPVAAPIWSLSALLAQADIQPADYDPSTDVTITSLTEDSRQVRQGSCFVAVRGDRCDGHSYVQSAAHSGAAVVVVDQDVEQSGNAVCVRVRDSRDAIARLAATYYSLRGAKAKKPRLIGITGTNGKTTVAWLLRSILKAAGQRVALLGTVEYDLVDRRCEAPLTTPGPVDLCRHLACARDAGADSAILEVSSHALHQKRTDGLALAVGVFTNLSGDHLDYHGTMDEYWRAKRRLFEALDGDAVAVVNFDDPVGELMASELRASVMSFGIDTAAAEVSGRIHTSDLSGSHFTLAWPSFELDVHGSLVGRHNVMNVVAAAAAAHALGVEPDVIPRAVGAFGGVPGRLQRVTPDGCPFTVFVDYAHTDDALNHALLAVRPLTAARLICVFGCGGDRDRGKRPRMAAVVGRIADVAYVTSDNPRTEDPQRIIDDILPGFGPNPPVRLEVHVDRLAAIEGAIAEARPGDTVVIAGKGHETYQLVGDRVLDFDDVEIARACLQAAVTGDVT